MKHVKTAIQWIIVLLLIFLPLYLINNSGKTELELKNVHSVMDTFVSVRIFDEGISVEKKQEFCNAVFAEFENIDSAMSSYKPDSYISALNAGAGIAKTELPAGITGLLRKALKYSYATDGAFDVTTGPLIKAWNIMADTPRVPSGVAIDSARSLTGYQFLRIEGYTGYLQKKGMSVDMGGVAKGYALERGRQALQSKNVKDFIIDAGGDLAISLNGGKTATIKIVHPRKENEFWGQFETGSNAVATSGDYQRFFIQDGKRYHHIFNPFTGYPAESVVSVTVVHPDAADADILATGIFVLGPEKGLALLRQIPEAEGLIIWQEGDSLKSEYTAGMIDKYKFTANSIDGL